MEENKGGKTPEQKYQEDYYQKRKDDLNEAKRKRYVEDEAYREQAQRRSKRQYWMKQRAKRMSEKEELGAELVTIEPSAELEVVVDNPEDLRHGQTVTVKVYTTPKVGELMGRSALTIRLWLRNGILPEPFYRGGEIEQKVAKGKNPRLYTEDEMRVLEKCREHMLLPKQMEEGSIFSRCMKDGFSTLVQGLRPVTDEAQ